VVVAPSLRLDEGEREPQVDVSSESDGISCLHAVSQAGDRQRRLGRR
jgi:hypothetical protein